ncbi:MAG TPA: S8 family serine peptidase [Actinomycetota bacterium]|nr:S8 family serine peptidase [Actinomycetota bacterium]
MRPIRTIWFLLFAFAAAPLPLMGAVEPVVVAIVDSGLNGAHEAFDYRGPESGDDQVVAWWDFTRPGVPGPSDRWDARAEPSDETGHGTVVAGLVAGRVPGEWIPAEGFEIAVAKVCDLGGCRGDIQGAIRWAVDVAGADVVVVSLGAGVPIPESVAGVHEAVAYARQHGALTVVSVGNGLANRNVGPGAGSITPFGSSADALVVGNDGGTGLQETWDPEVVADPFTDRAPGAWCVRCSTSARGSSIANARVGSVAAAALALARQAGLNPSPDEVETLLKRAARDTERAPSIEGYGVLDRTGFDELARHAVAGTTPPRPDGDVNSIYVEHVAGGLRSVWSRSLNGDATLLKCHEDPDARSGVIGGGVHPGFGRAERWDVGPDHGVVRVTIEFSSATQDLDLYAVEPAESGWRVVARADSRGSGSDSVMVSTARPVSFLVVGRVVLTEQPYRIAVVGPGGDMTAHSAGGLVCVSTTPRVVHVS